MAISIGSSQIMAMNSYCGLGKETSWGTGVTCTNQLFFESASITKKQNSKILEEIVRGSSRAYTDRVLTSVMVDGELTGNFRADEDSCILLLGNALGGAITSSTVSAASCFLHTINIGDMQNNTNTAGAAFQGISINLKKGGTDGKVFEYIGCRVNELMFTAEIDEPLKFSATLIGKDATLTTNDISSVMTNTTCDPLMFSGGRISIELTTTSLATAASWHVQSIEFGISNNLKSDTEAREIGSDTLSILPPGVANITLNCSMRFDTTTAWSAMMAGTKYSAQLEFVGATISGAGSKQYLQLNFPKIYIREGAEPEIGGPDEILKTDLVFDVLCDSVTGYAMNALVQNGTASY